MSHPFKDCHPDQGLQPAWRDLLLAPQAATSREQQVLRRRARPDSQESESERHGGRSAPSKITPLGCPVLAIFWLGRGRGATRFAPPWPNEGQNGAPTDFHPYGWAAGPCGTQDDTNENWRREMNNPG